MLSDGRTKASLSFNRSSFIEAFLIFRLRVRISMLPRMESLRGLIQAGGRGEKFCCFAQKAFLLRPNLIISRKSFPSRAREHRWKARKQFEAEKRLETSNLHETWYVKTRWWWWVETRSLTPFMLITSTRLTYNWQSTIPSSPLTPASPQLSC